MSFRYHAFVCTQNRPADHPRGSCAAKGGGAFYQRLLDNMRGHMLWEAGVAVAEASCLGHCDAGPLMVVYPENIWYRLEKPEDIDEIVTSHFIEGKPVEHLRVEME